MAVGCGTPSDDKNTGSGGATASGGSASGGSGPTSGADLCGAQFDAMEAKCPLGADSRAANVADCQQQQRDYDGNGCRQQFDAWLVCTTKPPYDCANDTGCETTQAGYFMCQSRAVQRTGCVRLGPQDVLRCSDPTKPYAFSCLSAAPASCVQVVTEGAGIWCCPQI
jgi:hypothetical protein